MTVYSKEFRREVLAACDSGGGTREVALKFNVSESWVRRIKQERREQGKTAPQTTRNRRNSWQPYADWILARLDQARRPDQSGSSSALGSSRMSALRAKRQKADRAVL